MGSARSARSATQLIRPVATTDRSSDTMPTMFLPVLSVLSVLLVVILGVRGTGAASMHVDDPVSVILPDSPSASLKGILELTLAVDPPATEVKRNMLSCSARRPGTEEFVVLEERSQGRLSLLGDGLKKGKCGVRVQPVSADDAGSWTLRAVYDEGTVVSAKATVTLREFSGSVKPDKPSVDEGSTLRLQLVPDSYSSSSSVLSLSSCVVIPPSGRTLVLQEPQGPQDDRITYDGEGVNHAIAAGWCAVKVQPVQPIDDGVWVLEATDKVTGFVYRGRADLHVYVRAVSVLPVQVEVEEGDHLVLQAVFTTKPGAAPLPFELRGCQAVRPDGAVVQLTGTGPSTGNLTKDESVAVASRTRHGSVCAAELGPLAQRHAGKWTLRFVGADGSERLDSSTVFVKGPYTAGRRPDLVVEMGTGNQPLRCGPDDAVSCTLREPSGQDVASFRGPCVFSVDKVRARHEGTWRCTALAKQYAHPVEDLVVLRLAAAVRTQTGVSWVSPDRVVLECSLTGDASCSSSPSYCRFDSPDGRSFLVREFVESSSTRLTYAGLGLNTCDCSVALRGPFLDADYGAWRCMLGYDSLTPRGGFVNLTRAPDRVRTARQIRGDALAEVTKTATAIRLPMTGAVRPGQDFTVGCRVNRALSYCWLQTPRGERISLVEKSLFPRYAGLGFELGECAAVVENAVPANHSGTWRCGMGFAGSADASVDLEVAVDMVVSDSLVVPLRQNVTPSSGEARLGCRTVMSEALEWCRFVRPDGISLHVADASPVLRSSTEGRYKFDGEAGSLRDGFCAVTISSPAEADWGEWTCSVALAGDLRGAEQTAKIYLADLDVIAEATLLGVGLGLFVLATVFGAVMLYRRYAPPMRMPGGRGRRPRRQDMQLVEMDAVEVHDDSVTGPTTRSRTARTTSRVDGGTSVTSLTMTRLPARSARTRADSLPSVSSHGSSEDLNKMR